jgi:hypothetical protein
MNQSEKFVCGGGWVEREKFGRPKLRLWTTLTIGWAALSAFPLGWLVAVPAMREDLIFLLPFGALALPQIAFLSAAIFFWRTEKPIAWIERLPNSDYDERKLY